MLRRVFLLVYYRKRGIYRNRKSDSATGRGQAMDGIGAEVTARAHWSPSTAYRIRSAFDEKPILSMTRAL